MVDGTTVDTRTGCGRLYVTLNEFEGEPFETFAHMGKAGGCASSQIEAIGRLISLALRFGIGAEEVVKQIKGISCHEKYVGGPTSCADGIGKLIEQYLERRAAAQPEQLECVDNEQEVPDG